jgi:hypothetical protein
VIVRRETDDTKIVQIVGAKADGTAVLWHVSVATAMDARSQGSDFHQVTADEYDRLVAGATVY